jgi:hypothetical protein
MQLKHYVVNVIRYFGLTSLIGLDSVDQTPLMKGDIIAPETNPSPPVFVPPGTGNNTDNRIKCDYKLPGWWHPDSPGQRHVWLRNNETGHEYNISTNYETTWPQGRRRDVSI